MSLGIVAEKLVESGCRVMMFGMQLFFILLLDRRFRGANFIDSLIL
jgi:hypothetical protein